MGNQDKLWIPKHVWNEYLENWQGVCKQCRRSLENSQSSFNKNIDKFNIKNAAGLVDHQKQGELKVHLNHLRNEIKAYYANEKKKYTESQNQKIFENVHNWLETKIGDGFKIREIVKIMEEGEIRYKNIIPPGYEDTDKKNGNRFGDLIIWKEIINKAKSERVNIVFVTEDVKNDWGNPKSRLLLNQEFSEETGKKIQILTVEDYQRIYWHKPPTKSVSEALAQLDEMREKYFKIYNEMFANDSIQKLFSESIAKWEKLPDGLKFYMNDFVRLFNLVPTQTIDYIKELDIKKLHGV